MVPMYPRAAVIAVAGTLCLAGAACSEGSITEHIPGAGVVQLAVNVDEGDATFDDVAVAVFDALTFMPQLRGGAAIVSAGFSHWAQWKKLVRWTSWLGRYARPVRIWFVKRAITPAKIKAKILLVAGRRALYDAGRWVARRLDDAADVAADGGTWIAEVLDAAWDGVSAGARYSKRKIKSAYDGSVDAGAAALEWVFG